MPPNAANCCATDSNEVIFEFPPSPRNKASNDFGMICGATELSWSELSLDSSDSMICVEIIN